MTAEQPLLERQGQAPRVGGLDRTVEVSRGDGSWVRGAGFSADTRRRSFSFRESVEGSMVESSPEPEEGPAMRASLFAPFPAASLSPSWRASLSSRPSRPRVSPSPPTASRAVMAEGKERTVLSGRAKVKSGTLSISADRIELNGQGLQPPRVQRQGLGHRWTERRALKSIRSSSSLRSQAQILPYGGPIDTRGQYEQGRPQGYVDRERRGDGSHGRPGERENPQGRPGLPFRIRHLSARRQVPRAHRSALGLQATATSIGPPASWSTPIPRRSPSRARSRARSSRPRTIPGPSHERRLSHPRGRPPPRGRRSLLLRYRPLASPQPMSSKSRACASSMARSAPSRM